MKAKSILICFDVKPDISKSIFINTPPYVRGD